MGWWDTGISILIWDCMIWVVNSTVFIHKTLQRWKNIDLLQVEYDHKSDGIAVEFYTSSTRETFSLRPQTDSKNQQLTVPRESHNFSQHLCVSNAKPTRGL